MPPIDTLPSEARRELLHDFMRDVFMEQRRRLLAYFPHTVQSAQVDSDGYVGQIIASFVTGVPGNFRRGKNGSNVGDLCDGTEVKSAYRAEQLNGREDSHVNFGRVSPEKLGTMTARHPRVIVSHISYDQLDRLKCEVLELPMDHRFAGAVREFQARSNAARPQLQPRLYPDGCRDRLQVLPGHFPALGARLVARAVLDGDQVVVDKWSPEEGLPLEECLELAPGAGRPDAIPHAIRDPWDPDEFFIECMVRHRRALSPFCSLAGANENVGFGNLAQHLVSIVTRIPGTGSGARGFDLVDKGEIKLAMGVKGDALGTEDFPRLNLQRNHEKMLSWKALFPVRIICPNDLAVKVFRAPIDEFRAQVRDYFGPGSLYERSVNMQYQAPKTFESNVFTGKRGDGSPRLLDCEVLYCAKEQPGGGCVRC